MKLNFEKLKKIFQKDELKEICRQNDVEMLALFGSTSRNEASEESDIDLLIRFTKPKSLLGHIGLANKFKDLLGKDVDLITENELSSHISENILKDLKIIYAK